MVQSNKYVTADTCYNMRVVECRLAAKLLAKYLNIPLSNVRILKDIQDITGLEFDQLIEKINEFLHQEPYTRKEIAKILEIGESDLTNNEYIGSKIQSDSFFLYHRSLHVYLESKQVEEFKALCDSNNFKEQQEEEILLKQLGDLMNNSHFTCRDNFNCSCPELEELTTICREAGAYGSRLTGAGWGGCTVSLVPKDKTEHFYETVKREYFTKFGNEVMENIDKYLFSTKPGSGAYIITL